MEDKRLDELLHQLNEEPIVLSPALVARTKQKLKRRGQVSLLIVAAIWWAMIQFCIGAVIIAIVPGLQQQWIWGILLWGIMSGVTIQLIMIGSMRNRVELQLFDYIRIRYGGRNGYE